MPDEDDGVLVTSLIAEVKKAIVAAGVTGVNPSRDLRVASVQLILEAVATQAGGGKVSFRVPFIGTEFNEHPPAETRPGHLTRVSRHERRSRPVRVTLRRGFGMLAFLGRLS